MRRALDDIKRKKNKLTLDYFVNSICSARGYGKQNTRIRKQSAEQIIQIALVTGTKKTINKTFTNNP